MKASPRRSSATLAAVTLLMVACGDDTNAGGTDTDAGTGSSGTTTTSGPLTTTTATTVATTGTTTPDTDSADTGSESSSGGSESTGGPDSVCGDGVVEGDEECDASGESNRCDADCTIVMCGDGTVNNAAGETCDDAGRSDTCNEDCTAASCGDGIINTTLGEVCDGDGAGNGGETATCDVDCTVRSCGDGIVNDAADEDCDGDGAGVGGETAACNADCTIAGCGDAKLNVTAGEICDEGLNNGRTARCNTNCTVGGGLDGTFGAAWETMATGSGNALYDLDSFHYAGTLYIHDWASAERYNVALNAWSVIPAASPLDAIWANAATEPIARWVPRGGSMWRYDTTSQTWSEAGTAIPNGSTQSGASVFDGNGHIWYHGPGEDLVRYDPAGGEILTFTHPDFGFMYETRMAYDPIGNIILFAGFENDTFARLDIDLMTFSQGTASPGGGIRDITCGDRSGFIYHGSDLDDTAMYQYDVTNDTHTLLPTLTWSNDNNSTCTVSETGFLYVGNQPSALYRLPLGTQ